MALLLHSRNRMKHLTERLYHTELGCTLVSMIFGVALAFMFQRVCKGGQCIVHKSPPSKDITDIVYEIPNDGCYVYSYKPVECADAQ